MKYHILQPVQLCKGGIPGVICDTAEAIQEYGVQPAYEVQWVDGNTDIRLECEIEPLKAANDEVYETA
ncbi:hypothetical protein PS49_220 [Aeromonas phage PS49]|jgi:hypothetical protein